MTTTATFVRDVHGSRASQKLWRLNPPIVMYPNSMDTYTIAYVVTSAVNVDWYGPETYIFRCDADGKVEDYLDLPGSYRGELNHERAIREAGWKMQGVE